VVISSIQISYQIVILNRLVKIISRIKRNTKKRKIKKANSFPRKTTKVMAMEATLWTKYIIMELIHALEATPQVEINLKY
jgi:hypothetical protein